MRKKRYYEPVSVQQATGNATVGFAMGINMPTLLMLLLSSRMRTTLCRRDSGVLSSWLCCIWRISSKEGNLRLPCAAQCIWYETVAHSEQGSRVLGS